MNIEQAAHELSAEREKLTDIVTDLNKALSDLKAAYLKQLKAAVKRTAAKHHDLAELITAAPGLFVRPKSLVFHGIQVGYGKRPGGVKIEDPQATLKLIKKHFEKDIQDLLIKTKETLKKKAIGSLTVADAKKIGATIVNATDGIIIRPVDTAVDDLVDALLEDATNTTDESEPLKQAA